MQISARSVELPSAIARRRCPGDGRGGRANVLAKNLNKNRKDGGRRRGPGEDGETRRRNLSFGGAGILLLKISFVVPFTLVDSVNEFLRREYQLRGGLTFLDRSRWKHSNFARGLPSALKSIDLQIAARAHIISVALLGRHKTAPSRWYCLLHKGRLYDIMEP